jgi:hypothetical protein
MSEGRVVFSRSSRFAGCIVASMLALASSALAEPGAYEAAVKNQMLSYAGKSVRWAAFPDEIKSRLSSCVAASVIQGFAGRNSTTGHRHR